MQLNCPSSVIYRSMCVLAFRRIHADNAVCLGHTFDILFVQTHGLRKGICRRMIAQKSKQKIQIFYDNVQADEVQIWEG